MNQAKARRVCVLNQSSTFADQHPAKINYPIVAANSTLAKVRKLEAPGYAEQKKDPILLSNQEGYAALCLFSTTDYGKPVDVWLYATPAGDTASIYTG